MQVKGFSEAELRGIDMAELMSEMSTHPRQVAFRNRWERMSEIFWELERGRGWRERVAQEALEVEYRQLLRLLTRR